jgi:hypothetical protein
MDLGKLQLGADADVAIKIESGKLVAIFSLNAEKELSLLVDKIEQLIPGDQTGIASAVKAILLAQLNK